MKQSGEIQSITVNNLTGAKVDLETVSPMLDADGKTQAERDWLVIVPRRDESAIVIMFVSTRKYFEQLSPTFEKMLESLQF
jgi:hypothetical protein